MNIKKYIEFLLENQKAGKMMITYSKEFRDIIYDIIKSDMIGRNIAMILGSIENTNKRLDTYTLIDKTDKNDMISYVQTSRLQREYGLSPEDMEVYKVGSDDKFWKVGRTPQYSIGRWVRHIFKDVIKSNIEDKDLEDFVNAYKAVYDKIRNKENSFFLVKGEDIRKWYLYENYESLSGQLGNSCMRYEKCQKYLDIYVDNTDVCQLLILKSETPNKIIGRALIWKLIDDTFYMDRIYTINDSDRVLFEKYAKDNKISRYAKSDVKVNPINYDYYPYMDTFIIYNYEDGILSSKTDDYDDNLLELQNTDGSSNMISGRVWSDYHDAYLNEDSAKWCIDVNDWVREEFSIWLEYIGEYVTEDSALWSEYHSNYFLTKDLVWSECMNSYLYKKDKDIIELKKENGKDYCIKDMFDLYQEIDGEYYPI
jgi:hypothetical protein